MPAIKSLQRNMDPYEMQNRFSDESHTFYRLDESGLSLDDLEPYIDRLPQREKDLIDMYYRDQKKQKEIADFFGVTQGAVSHRLSRARKRLAFLRDMPKLRKSQDEILKDHFTGFEVDVIKTMIETTCQSRTAEILNQKYRLRGDKKMTQVKVRHKYERFLNKIKKLSKISEDMMIMYRLAKYVRENLYMMHEVILPHFNKGYKVKYKGTF